MDVSDNINFDSIDIKKFQTLKMCLNKICVMLKRNIKFPESNSPLHNGIIEVNDIVSIIIMNNLLS